MSPPSSPHPRPLELIDKVLESIGNAIHDGPVQDIVVAKLLAEVVLPPADRDELGDRTIGALRRANTNSRQLMWALATPHVREGHLADDLSILIAGAEGDTVQVQVAQETAHHLVAEVVRALHRVVAGAALAGHVPTAVVLRGDAEGVECEVVVDGPPPPEDAELTVWQQLAAAQLGQSGGSISVAAAGSQTRIHLELSEPGD